MAAGLKDRIGAAYHRLFPTREVYVRSEGHVRYVTLTPRIQVIAAITTITLIAWATTFTILSYLSDTEIATRDQEMVDVKRAYEARVGKLLERYRRLESELEESELRFDKVMRRLSGKHGLLENAAGVELALQGRLDANQRRLREVTEQRDDALTKLEEIRYRSLEMERRLADAQRLADQRRANLNDFVATLEDTATERDAARGRVQELSNEVATLEKNVEDIRRHQSQVMAQLEEAARTSIGELESVLAKTGVNIDSLVNEIERAYRGEGGPFTPIAYRVPDAARNLPIAEPRVAATLHSLQRVNSLRIALEKVPLAKPLKDSYRVSSSYGKRKNPVTGIWAMHHGLDLAAPKGTRIYPPVDGTVVFAGTQRGYGKVVKIDHALGFQTVYGHMSKIEVQKGDTVTRGTVIGRVGNTGRSTGDHLHYEIRLHGRTLNPRKFIEAGRYVFQK
ncbi:MAG: DUF5930 domain-containing protein [Neomegalonema sp.]|nr:DUF5930 domain-containing protein [Neomegalonema sp.]